MSFRRILRSFGLALAAALANMPRLVWEGGKWVAKTFFPGQPQQEAMAEQELIEEILRPRELPAVETGYEDPREAWGRAAADRMMPCGEPLVHPEAVLDERAQCYLDSLNVMERAALLAYEPKHIGLFLLGERKLKGLPPVPTAAEFTAAEKARLAALAGPVREGLAEMQKRIDAVVEVMRSEGYAPAYTPPRRAA